MLTQIFRYRSLTNPLLQRCGALTYFNSTCSYTTNQLPPLQFNDITVPKKFKLEQQDIIPIEKYNSIIRDVRKYRVDSQKLRHIHVNQFSFFPSQNQY